MTALFRAVVGFLLVKLFTLVVNLVQFPVLGKADPTRPLDEADPVRPLDEADPVRRLDEAAPPRSRPVSLLVPMRDEAANLGRTLPAMLRQRGVAELILLDDQSSDGSVELAKSILADFPHTRIVSGTPAPSGWVGKNWACQQLGEAASSELLLFCDADVLLGDGAIEAVLAELHGQRAEVFSVFPRQRTETLGEALITPLIDDVLLCFLPFWLLSLDIPAAATANGSLLLFDRQAYRQLGGFAAVRSDIVEDVALARRARRAGLRLGLALGGNLVETRMYGSYRETVQGLGRGLLAVTGGSRLRLLAAAGWQLAVYSLPLVAAPRHRRWLLPLALGLAERALVALKCNPGSVWQAALTPCCPIAFLPLVAQALRPVQHWKGRSIQ